MMVNFAPASRWCLRALVDNFEGPAALANESADLLYHLVVLWTAAGVDPATVWAALDRREGTSGIAEKNNRSTTGARRHD